MTIESQLAERVQYDVRVFRQMMSEALTQYLENRSDDDWPQFERDKFATAQKMLNDINAQIAKAGD